MTITELEKRHSVRSYTDEVLSEQEINSLKAEITYINCGDSRMHFSLYTNDNSPFKGFFKSYGFFRNPRNYIAAIVDPPATAHGIDDATMIAAGYYGEQLVMKAVELGLGTCFVGGTYDASKVTPDLKVGQKLLFLILVGHADTASSSTFISKLTKLIIPKKKDYLSFLSFADSGITAQQFVAEHSWIETGMRAVAVAPSALNKQPVRVKITGSDCKVALEVDSTPDRKNLIDLGIAMYNFQAVCGGFFEETNPAKYTPDL